jgi:tripartite-type tricarboxylate transporter receptor subunit TctC
VLAKVPSITETPVLANFEYASYAGYYVKKGTPVAIKEALNKAIGQALENRDVVAKLEADGRNVSPRMSLDEAAAAYAAEIAKHREMIRATGYVQAG